MANPQFIKQPNAKRIRSERRQERQENSSRAIMRSLAIMQCKQAYLTLFFDYLLE